MKGSTFFAFMGGMIMGGAIALLMAPQSGDKTRAQLKDMVDDGVESLKKRYNKTAEQMRHEAEIIKDAAKGAADDVRKRMCEAKAEVRQEQQQ